VAATLDKVKADNGATASARVSSRVCVWWLNIRSTSLCRAKSCAIFE